MLCSLKVQRVNKVNISKKLTGSFHSLLMLLLVCCRISLKVCDTTQKRKKIVKTSFSVILLSRYLR